MLNIIEIKRLYSLKTKEDKNMGQNTNTVQGGDVYRLKVDFEERFEDR